MLSIDLIGNLENVLRTNRVEFVLSNAVANSARSNRRTQRILVTQPYSTFGN